MPDPSISPTSNMDISDTSSDTNQPTTGADAITPPTQQGPQDQPGSNPAPAIPQPHGAQGPQTPPAQPQTPEQPSTVGNDPAVAHANRFYKFATALAGGPRYTETIDATGKSQYKPVPLSKGDIGMAIALEAISGALTGLSQTGPAAAAKGGAAAFQQAQAQRQTADAQQDQQANADFARHAQVFETNMRLHNNAQIVGRQNYDVNTAYVSQFKPLADQLQTDHPEVVKGLIDESDMAKYHVTKDSAIPVNVVKRMDLTTGQQAVNLYGEPQWDIQYLVIDPHFKSDDFLSADDRAEAAKFRLPGFADSDGKPSNLPQSLPMKLNMALGYKARIASLKLADNDIDNYYKALNDGKDGTKYAPVNLVDAVKKDPTLTSALEKFQPMLNATQQNYARAIGELGKTNPQAAGKILALYGGTQAVNTYDQQKALKAESAKRQIDNQAEIDKDKALIPVKAATAGAEETARQAVKPQTNSDVLTTPDALGVVPSAPDMKEYNKRFIAFKTDASSLAKTEQTYSMFSDVLRDINAGKDLSGAASVVALFNAIGLSGTALKGQGFRVNQNVIAEHEHARGWLGELQNKLLKAQTGSVINPSQIRDYANIAASARRNQYVSLVNQAHNSGLSADPFLPTGNGQHIDPNTVAIFLALTNGDKDKARQAATSKGWSF